MDEVTRLKLQRKLQRRGAVFHWSRELYFQPMRCFDIGMKGPTGLRVLVKNRLGRKTTLGVVGTTMTDAKLLITVMNDEFAQHGIATCGATRATHWQTRIRNQLEADARESLLRDRDFQDIVSHRSLLSGRKDRLIGFECECHAIACFHLHRGLRHPCDLLALTHGERGIGDRLLKLRCLC